MADTTKNPGQATSSQPTGAQKAPLAGSEQTSHRPFTTTSTMTNTETTGKTANAGEMIDQAKQTVNDVYERATRSVNETLGQAKEYSRENPGTATLVAFGVGVGVGVLLASGVFNSGRSRTQRIVPPVMNALSEIAGELFRR
ncbi:MAG TPA: hypothetical protein VFZ34_25135 [Blastocatellia bacterium]|nr:hypothetical protein [Blastocatellia bacterium]